MRKFQGKTVKLKSASSKLLLMNTRLRLLAVGLLVAIVMLVGSESASPTGAEAGPRQRQSRRLTSSAEQDENDPMEQCYLANNRASETLTISESTPVGTVVGEIMVSVVALLTSARLGRFWPHLRACHHFRPCPHRIAMCVCVCV